MDQQFKIISNQISKKDAARLHNAQYRLIGKHSAVKICSWCKSDLRGTPSCYKNKYYGIKSFQCLQMTPTMQFCTENCNFCWRPMRYHNNTGDDWDSPKFILDGCIEAQRELLSGFGGNEKTDPKKWAESYNPKHVAISLSGEPTLYPYLPELIDEIKSRNMTAFLVTNGTQPEMIRKLIDHPPTQLYVTVAGPTWEILKKATNPMLEDTWARLHETLSLLKHFKRTVIRLTLVKGINMSHPELYAEFAEKYKPTYLEAKGYVAVGGSVERLGLDYMPLHEEIKEFSEQIAQSSSFKIRDEKIASRCVLLTKNGTDLPNYAHEMDA